MRTENSVDGNADDDGLKDKPLQPVVMNGSRSTDKAKYDRQIAASEAMIKSQELMTELELVMRHPDPNRVQLAIIRSNCADIVAKLEIINYWAMKSYRNEGE